MGKKFDKVGGGSYGVYKERKGSNVVSWIVGIVIFLIIVGAIT